MFIRLKTFLDAHRQAARAEVLDETVADLRARLSMANKEIRRLTTSILQMREQGFSLGPEAFDDRWPGGKYVMDEVENERLADPLAPLGPEDPYPREVGSDDDALIAEEEALFHKELEKALSEN